MVISHQNKNKYANSNAKFVLFEENIKKLSNVKNFEISRKTYARNLLKTYF